MVTKFRQVADTLAMLSMNPLRQKALDERDTDSFLVIKGVTDSSWS